MVLLCICRVVLLSPVLMSMSLILPFVRSKCNGWAITAKWLWCLEGGWESGGAQHIHIHFWKLWNLHQSVTKYNLWELMISTFGIVISRNVKLIWFNKTWCIIPQKGDEISWKSVQHWQAGNGPGDEAKLSMWFSACNTEKLGMGQETRLGELGSEVKVATIIL